MFYFRRLLEIIGLLSVIFIVSSILLISKITNHKTAPLQEHYDAIIILSGNFERASRASKLFFDKRSQYIYLSREEALINDYNSSFNSKKTYKVYLEIIQKKGIHPKNVILFGSNNTSTLDEAKELKKLNTQGISDVLVVTDTFHRFRAEKIFDSMGFQFRYDFDVQNPVHKWYENKTSILIVLSELMKCYLYYTFEDFDAYLDYL